MKDFKSIEPLKNNRWIIKIQGLDIEPYLFRGYKIFNDKDKLMFSTEILETVIHHINPINFFKINIITLEFLDPIGNVVNGLTFTVKGLSFEQVGDYGSDNLLTYKLLIEIDKGGLYQIFKIKGNGKND
jgi:hypothetical protein